MSHNISLQIPKKKRRKWEQKHLCARIKESFSSYGLTITMPVEHEGDEIGECDMHDVGSDCSVLIHKFNPLLGDVWAGNPQAVEKYRRSIKQLSVAGVIVIDPLPNVLQVINRYQLYEVLSRSKLFDMYIGDKRICLPKTILVSKCLSNKYDNSHAVQSNNIHFPCMFKPLIANGEEKSHQLALILNERGLLSLANEEGVIQEFINHLPVLYKLFVINDECFLVHRSSIKNIDVSRHSKLGPRYDFDSRLVSSPNASCELIEVLPQENIRKHHEPSDKMLSAIKNTLSQVLGITLFGADIIKDLTSDDYYLIDVNYFPGYEGIPDFPNQLAQHVLHYSTNSSLYPKPVCSQFIYTADSRIQNDDHSTEANGTNH